ncbi:MAG: hypothetical protein HY685_06900 [Chloroflexi bacterium]|nr:hypothetical protein [Chloroflexota bacterium]
MAARLGRAATFATACPFCTQMFEDGVKVKNAEEKMRVRDISEMVAERLEAARPVPARGSE